MNQMEQFINQMAVLVATLGLIWLMSFGCAVMTKPFITNAPSRYARWSWQIAIARPLRAIVHFASRHLERLGRSILHQVWRFVRWAPPALYRAIAGLL